MTTEKIRRPAPRLERLLCLDDFERAACRHLPRPLFAYVSGAVETNQSLRANRNVYEEIGLVPSVLNNVSRRDCSVSLLGRHYAAPFAIAPLGLSAMTSYRGDLVLAQGACSAGIPMIMSGSSLIRLEEVAAIYPDAWFQAYLPGDDAQIEALIDRVETAGFHTLVITVDTPVPANRENNVRAGFSTPLRPSLRLAWDGLTHPRWLFGTLLKTLLHHGIPHFENNYAHRGQPIISPGVVRDFSDRGHLSWEHLTRIRRRWKGHLVVKGLLQERDALKARDLGADALVLSNHGGRQLDGAVPAMRVIERIATACGDLPVLLDGGIRRGTDVIKALALGARMVLVGRPFAYAAAVGGQAGVQQAIALLAAEVSRDMAMLGITSLEQLDAGTHLMRSHSPGARS